MGKRYCGGKGGMNDDWVSCLNVSLFGVLRCGWMLVMLVMK